MLKNYSKKYTIDVFKFNLDAVPGGLPALGAPGAPKVY